MEKMCTAQTAKDNGYASDITIDGEKCLTTETFLGHFSKEHYSVEINGSRDAKQLFPFSDVQETKITLEPSISFANYELEIEYNNTELTNTIESLENLDNLTVSIVNTTNSGISYNGKAEIVEINNEKNVSITLDENNSTVEWKYTVTVKGDRTDGEGTFSDSFSIVQWYHVIPLQVNNGLSTIYNKLIIKGNDGTYLTENAGINLCLKEGPKDGVNIFDSTFESCKWTFNISDGTVFRYVLRLKDENGNILDSQSDNGKASFSLTFDDCMDCYQADLWFYDNDYTE